MTTMDAAAPAAGRARPLTDGELAAAWWVGAAAAALGVMGFVNCFRAVARARGVLVRRAGAHGAAGHGPGRSRSSPRWTSCWPGWTCGRAGSGWSRGP